MNFPPGKNVKVLVFCEEIFGTMFLVKGLCTNWMINDSSSYMTTCIEDIEQLGMNNIGSLTHKAEEQLEEVISLQE